MKEIWKDILGYEGLYQVSNFGRVKSLKRKWVIKDKILKPTKNRNGYIMIILCKKSMRKNILLHRLVAEAFLPNPHNLPQVNHKDEQKNNNVVTNLEWCDAKYNNCYGTKLNRYSLKRSKPVLQYTLDGEFVREWASTMECGRNGFQQGNIIRCCIGKYKQHKGFIWKFKNA